MQKTENREQRTEVFTSGFTMIELIVASGIFVMITLVGLAVLSSSVQSEQQTVGQRLLGQTSRFVLEAMGREIRLANGAGTDRPPFIIVSAGLTPALPDPIDQRLSGSRIQITSTDQVSQCRSERRIELATATRSDGTTHRFAQMTAKSLDSGCPLSTVPQTVPLTPDSVEVDALTFRGLSSSATALADRQPFVEITLALRWVVPGKDGAASLSQTTRTTVTTRAYQF